LSGFIQSYKNLILRIKKVFHTKSGFLIDRSYDPAGSDSCTACSKKTDMYH